MKNKRGITLVALVIAVIVLLILASISIGFLFGDSGILNKGAKANKDTVLAQVREELDDTVSIALSRSGGDLKYSILVEELDKKFNSNGYTIDPNSNDSTKWTIKVKTSYGDIVKVVGGRPDATPVPEPDQWEGILATATKHTEQCLNEDVGVDANGDPINLDLWSYSDWGGEITLCGSVGNYSTICYYPFLDGDFLEYLAEDYGVVIGSEYGCYDEDNPQDPIEVNYTNIEYYNLVLPQYIKIKGTDTFLPVTKIAGGAFENTCLESVVLPSTLKEIDSSAFSSCYDLTQINFNEGLETLGPSAFESCQLNELVLPSSLKEIGGRAFSYNSLEKVIFSKNMNVNVNNSAFDDNYATLSFEFKENVKAKFDKRYSYYSYGWRQKDVYIYLDNLIVKNDTELTGDTNFIDAENVIVYLDTRDAVNSFYADASTYDSYFNLSSFPTTLLIYFKSDWCDSSKPNVLHPLSILGSEYDKSGYHRIEDDGAYAVYKWDFDIIGSN